MFERIRQLSRGGIVVTDPVDPGVDERIGFRTLVQLDGHLCVTIDARTLALEPARLERAYERHLGHVDITLRRLNRSRWYSRVLAPTFAGIVAAGGVPFLDVLAWTGDFGFAAGFASVLFGRVAIGGVSHWRASALGESDRAKPATRRALG